MRNINKVVFLIGLFFITTVNYAQIEKQESKVVISEAEIISLTKTLKKYKNTSILNNTNVRDTELDSLNKRINKLTELLSLYKESNSLITNKQLSENVIDTVYNKSVLILPKETAVVQNNNSTIKQEKAINNTEDANALKLAKLEQEIIALDKKISKGFDEQLKYLKATPKAKEVKTFVQTPPVFIDKTVVQTDTVYVLKENNGSKTVDSLNMKLLAEKNDQLINQQLLIDSLKNKLLEKEINIPVEIKKEAEVSTLKLYFFNNEFNLNEINKAILDELFLNTSTAKAKFYIKGFASATGNANYNKIISTKRSQAVYNYLLKIGIKPEVIESASFGVDNNEKDASKARRVEIEITRML
jgi:outer membrane protein OmpA-like peptidoglycan-associated protein